MVRPDMRAHLEEPMDTIRLIVIIAAAIILAVLALKIVFFVAGLLISLLVSIAVFAAVAYIVYLLARSVLHRRTSP
jgi:Flp pilus assembly protein TadB